jgi:hypothetical protein
VTNIKSNFVVLPGCPNPLSGYRNDKISITSDALQETKESKVDSEKVWDDGVELDE